MTPASPSRAFVEVDLDAVAHNVRLLRQLVAPAEVCVVVKADGYGHGATAVALAATAAGAASLAVAVPAEGAELRDARVGQPILLLSEPDEWRAAVSAGLEVTVYSDDGIDGLVAELARRGARAWPVHLKIDTGMHRVGAPPEDAARLARRIVERPELRLAAVWTHCPVADEPENPFTAQQSARFDAIVDGIRAGGVDVPRVHAANSAAALAWPQLRHDVVRSGIAVYGLAPSPALAGAAPLRPALSLRSTVSYVRTIRAGEAVSYGLRRPAPTDTVIATVPIGYADGVPRRLGETGGEVLVGGRRCAIAGTVTMDQLLVDCGPRARVSRGDEVVLIGAQGSERVTADEWAERLGTINYEIVCGIGPRVPRVHVGASPAPSARSSP